MWHIVEHKDGAYAVDGQCDAELSRRLNGGYKMRPANPDDLADAALVFEAELRIKGVANIPAVLRRSND